MGRPPDDERPAASLGLCGRFSLVGFWLGEDDAPVNRQRIELDRETGFAGFEGPCPADANPEGVLILAALLDGVGDEGWFLAHEIFLSFEAEAARLRLLGLISPR